MSSPFYNLGRVVLYRAGGRQWPFLIVTDHDDESVDGWAFQDGTLSFFRRVPRDQSGLQDGAVSIMLRAPVEPDDAVEPAA